MFADALRERTKSIADLSSQQLSALERHYDLMLKWNKVLNLTRITDEVEAVERHYFESLFLASHLPSAAQRISDIGSGPGFPGIPVAVLRPDCELTLIESHLRKAVFLREATRALPNVKVLARRAEEVDCEFDLITSRGVSYEDLAPAVAKLASSALLLTGDEMPPADWIWDWEAIPVPGRRATYLRIGSKVSRETRST